MEGLLTLSIRVALLWLICIGVARADLSDRHELSIRLDWSFIETDSDLGAWPDGGFGKLRYAGNQSGIDTSRLAIEYTGQIRPTWFAHLVADAIGDAETTAGVTEAFIEWRPLPGGPARNRFRIGAFYPEFSVENSDFAWESPYAISFSAINTWIGEEIRPIGLEWSSRRPLGSPGSPHELDLAAGVFYGNDTAGTLFFWRGWSIHNRQTRLNERLRLPSLVFGGRSPDSSFIVPRKLDPIAEIDDAPGLYLASHWRYQRRLKIGIALYDNRADPLSFRDGQWAWDTQFWQLSAQASLPGDFALLTQKMRGRTDWIIPPDPAGTIGPDSMLVQDEFESSYVLLSKSVHDDHRVSLRFDTFDFWRPGQLTSDKGNAVAVAWGLAVHERLNMTLEWMQIESSRGLWPLFYGLSDSRRTESVLQLGFSLELFNSTG